MAAEKKAAKKVEKKAKKAAAPKKPKFGSDMVITGLPAENPRREGNVSYDKFADMVKFMKKKPTATVADVIANTTSKRNDFEWDLEREAFKVKKAGKAPKAAAAEEGASA